MVRGQQHAASSSSAVSKPRRQRASPARLVKLYKDLTEPQRRKIRSIGFGGLLKIGSQTLPTGFADWLMGECYDADSSELVLPGRGRIAVNAHSVCGALGLPKNGDEVKYEMDVDAINFIHGEYGIDEGIAPSIDTILERLKRNRTANDDFLRSWLMIAISTFLCPPTGTAISPRCYPAIVDLSKVKKLNWCQFVVDQLKVAASKMGKRKSFKGCLLVLVIVYVDSLLVDNVVIPSTTPRVAAWSKQLLDQVIKLDTKLDGSFGNLKLKGSSYCTPQLSMFHLDDIRRFVSSKVPSGMSDQKKQTLNNATIQFCSGFTELLGTFLEQVSRCEAPAPQRVGSTKRPRASCTEGEPSSAQRDSRPKRSKLERDGPSCAQMQTRAMRWTHAAEDESLGEEYEEDLLSDDNGEGNTDEDSEDEDEGHDSESDDLAHDSAFDDDGNGNGNLPPILEDDLVDEDKGNGNQDENGSAAPEEPNLDATGADSEDLCHSECPFGKDASFES